MFKHLPHFLCAFSELFLKSANQFVILTFCVCEIVVGQLGVLLFELTFDFVPGAFELQFIHSSYSAVAKQSVVLLGTAALDRRKFIESEAVLRPFIRHERTD